MKKLLLSFLNLILLFPPLQLKPQTNLDSLWQVWNNQKLHDTIRLQAIEKMAWKGFLYSNPDSAFALAQLEYNFSKQKNLKKYMANALNTQGTVSMLKSNYRQALEYYDKSLKIMEEINDKQGIASSYNNIGNIYLNQGNYSKALEYNFKSLKIREEIGDKQGIARTYNNIGSIYTNQSNYSRALEYYDKSLKIMEEINDKQGIASSYNNIGIIYYEQGNYSKALEYYFKSLKIQEEINDKQGIANSYNNIGLIYANQGNYSKALEHYFNSLKIREEIGDKQGIADSYNNIGLIYVNQGNYSKALEHYFNSLKIQEEIGDKQGIANSYSNIGSIYADQSDYSKALEYFSKGLEIDKEIGDQEFISASLSSIAQIYLNEKNYQKAKEYAINGLQIAKEIGNTLRIKEASQTLYETYKHLKQYKDALEMFELYVQTKDTLNSKENRKALQTMELKYQYEKEQAIKEKEHQKQLAIQQKEKERQKVISYAVTAGLILVLIFSIVIYNRLQITRNQKKIIEEQKQMVEQQKKLVEEKNKEITDSIVYAKRIQDAILPSDAKWQTLLPDSFVLYLPKDIIAGDFYWLEETEDYIFVAAADCTGHGVPGAMVSVVCSNALTKAVMEEKLTETDQILNKTRELVIEKLTSEDNIRDGMDICLIRINKERKQIQYSGANRPLYVIKDGNIEEYKPDKQPIGRYEESKPFTKQEINLTAGTTLYLTTDGYADQFGGNKGKKIGNKAFKEKLLLLSEMNMEEQKQELQNFFTSWKGNEEQMDDVTVVGIRV
jgi:tetratricopeptide (TPR) repeat protein